MLKRGELAQITPAAHVVPAGIGAGRADGTTGFYSQKINRLIAVIVTFRGRDKASTRGLDGVDTILDAVIASTYVEYTPISENFESLAIRYLIDGTMYVARGCRGNVKFDLAAYQRPMMRFKFTGYDTWATVSDGIGANFAAWQRPLVITDANSGDIRLGGTYTGGGNVTGGTVLASRGLEIDLGNTVSHIKLLGGEAIDITRREAMGRMSVALSAADEVTWRSDINANAVTSLGFNFGTTAGNKVVLYAPKVQRIDPQAEDVDGRHLLATELRLLPDAGDDELVFTVK